MIPDHAALVLASAAGCQQCRACKLQPLAEAAAEPGITAQQQHRHHTALNPAPAATLAVLSIHISSGLGQRLAGTGTTLAAAALRSSQRQPTLYVTHTLFEHSHLVIDTITLEPLCGSVGPQQHEAAA